MEKRSREGLRRRETERTEAQEEDGRLRGGEVGEGKEEEME